MKLQHSFDLPAHPLNQTDVDAANRFNEMQVGVFTNPICLGEQYPESILTTLPGAEPFTKEDLEYIGGSIDFVGIDAYTSNVISVPAEGIEACKKQNLSTNALYPYCVNQDTINVYGWDIGYASDSYVYITPAFLRPFLV